MDKEIWLISSYGTIPGEPWRDYRFAIFSKFLAANGYKVTWWTSGFAHYSKKTRSKVLKDIRVSDCFTVRLVPTTEYKRNVGIARIVSSIVFGIRAYSIAKRLPPPCCIVTGESPVSFGFAGFRLARLLKVKLVYDQIDLWPELFIKMVPTILKVPVFVCCLPIFLSRSIAYSRLDAITALSKKYLECVFNVNPRLRNKPHAVIYNGIDVEKCKSDLGKLPPPSAVAGIDANFVAIFSGGLGPSYDIETIIKATIQQRAKGTKLTLIIAGEGPLRPMVESYARESPESIVYVGMVSSSILWSIYAKCQIGFSAYKEGSNVEMPDKFYDYSAAGLAVINSLQGEVKDIIEEKSMGLTYEAGSVESCQRCICEMVRNPTTLLNMQGAAASAAEEFSSVRQSKQLLHLLDSLLASDVDQVGS